VIQDYYILRSLEQYTVQSIYAACLTEYMIDDEVGALPSGGQMAAHRRLVAAGVPPAPFPHCMWSTTPQDCVGPAAADPTTSAETSAAKFDKACYGSQRGDTLSMWMAAKAVALTRGAPARLPGLTASRWWPRPGPELSAGIARGLRGSSPVAR